MKVHFKLFFNIYQPLNITLDLEHPPATNDHVWLTAEMLGKEFTDKYPGQTEFVFTCTGVEWHYAANATRSYWYDTNVIVRLKSIE